MLIAVHCGCADCPLPVAYVSSRWHGRWRGQGPRSSADPLSASLSSPLCPRGPGPHVRRSTDFLWRWWPPPWGGSPPPPRSHDRRGGLSCHARVRRSVGGPCYAPPFPLPHFRPRRHPCLAEATAGQGRHPTPLPFV